MVFSTRIKTDLIVLLGFLLILSMISSLGCFAFLKMKPGETAEETSINIFKFANPATFFFYWIPKGIIWSIKKIINIAFRSPKAMA